MERQNVLVIGQGAREHALCQALAMSPWVDKMWASPGNPGMAELAHLDAREGLSAWLNLAQEANALTVVGPEVPLAAGLSDALRARGLAVVGPSRAGARLESSKSYAKEVMRQCGIPTARSMTVDGLDAVKALVASEWGLPVVIKEDGLAQGKGVFVITNEGQWQRFLGQARKDQGPFIVEEYLEGREISVEVFTNGRDYVWLPPAVDHKRLSADQESPNTGGMGAYSPVPWLSQSQCQTIDRQILEPIVGYLGEQSIDYRGVLYVGLMMTTSGPYVLEFNVRLGDPEAEVVLPLLADDLYPWLAELAQGRLLKSKIADTGKRAVGVVMAAEGYPEHPVAGRTLEITTRVPGTRIFQAGTEMVDGHLRSRGGRVLTVVGLGDDFSEARAIAYRQISAVEFPGAQFRDDIAEDLSKHG